MPNRRFLGLLLTLVLLAFPLAPVSAIEGGFTRNDYLKSVVPFLRTQSDLLPYCSGTLLSEFIIATAAHCVADGGGNALKEIWTAPAGIDVSKSKERYRVTGVYIPTGYQDSKSSAVTDNDIAFVTVKFSLGTTAFARIASLAEAKGYYGQSVVVGGYGRNRPSGPTSASPLFVMQRMIDWVLPQFTFGNYSHIIATDTESPCPGDSGGPMFKETPTGLAVLGVMAGTNGCVSTTAREERLVGFLIAAFATTHQLAKDAIAAAPKSPEGLKVATSGAKVTVSWQDVADTQLRATVSYLIKDSSGATLCEAKFLGIFNNATQCEFTVTENTSETVTLTPMGITKQGTPLTLDVKSAVSFAKEAIGAKVRAEADAKAKAEADAKAKVEADARAKAEMEAKLKAEAEAKARADAAVKTQGKKITITCIKSGIRKKVTGINPKCPTGYKRA